MSDPTTVPSIGFARGVVVRHIFCAVPRNMLVVRGLDETTACIVIEGDEGGTVRLREYPTKELRQILGHDDETAQLIEDLELTFDLRWKADMRAIERWRGNDPRRELVLPDHADLCVWLLEQLDAKPPARAEEASDGA